MNNLHIDKGGARGAALHTFSGLIGSIALIVAAAATIAYLVFVDYRNALQSAEAHADNAAHMIEVQLDAALRRADTVLDGIVRDIDDFSLSTQPDAGTVARIDAELDLRIRRFEEVAGLRIFSADGSLRYASGRKKMRILPNALEWEAFQAARDNGETRVFSSVFVAPAINRRILPMSQAIHTADGTLQAVVILFFDIEHFERNFSEFQFGEQGYIALRSTENGHLIARVPHNPERPLNQAAAADHPLHKLLADSEKHRAIFRYAGAPDKIERLYAMHRLGRYPFVTQAGLGVDEALAGWHTRNRMMMLLAFPLILLAIFARLHSQRVRRLYTESEERFRKLFDDSAEATLLIENGHFIDANGAARRMLRLPEDERIEDLAPETISPPHQPDGRESHEKAGEMIAHAIAEGSHRFEWLHRRCDGDFFFAEVTLTRIQHRDRQLLHVVWRDVSDRKQAEERLRLLATAFRHSGEALVITDRDARILEVNEAFTRITGYTPEEVIGQNPRILSAGKTPPETYREMWTCLVQDGFWSGELWDRHRDGHFFSKLLTISAFRGMAGEAQYYIGNFIDITERKASEERLLYLAHHDPLTQLPNRVGFDSVARKMLAHTRRKQVSQALMFIDLDHFKTINDTLGHHIGDLLLIEMAKRIRSIVRENDLVARLGGDEFVALLADVDAQAALAIGQKILDKAMRPLNLDGVDTVPSLSIGICIFPQDGETIEELMRHADLAMYEAKANGRSRLAFFAPEMNVQAQERMHLHNGLQHALDRDEFFLEYQPQLDATGTRVVGVEALLRWQHPEYGFVSPARFIPVAEETGLILPIGEWVLGEAVRQLVSWKQIGLQNITMAVNVSSVQMRDENFVSMVKSCLQTHGSIEEGDLELEVTESMAVERPELMISRMQALRSLGIRFAIDDFGTGYSSLAYLRRLPIDVLKLDRSFVQDIDSEQNDAPICTASIAMAHALGLEVVAEGVETRPQLDYLRNHGCEYIQGFHFSRPLSAEACEAYIRTHPHAGVTT